MLTYAQLILTNWNAMRWFRLCIGAYVAYEAFMTSDPMLGFISAFFLFQAVTNTGCTGSQGCAAQTGS